MKKQYLYILAGFGIFLVGGVVLIWQKNVEYELEQDIQKPVRSEQKQETSADIIARNLDISKWKTYRDDEYGFEFKYPEEIFEVFLEREGPDSNQNIPKKLFLTLNLFFDVNGNSARTPILSIFFNQPEDDYSADVKEDAKCAEVFVGIKKGKLCSNKTVFDEVVQDYESFKNKGACADNGIDSSIVVELASRNIGQKKYTDGISINLYCDHKESLWSIYRSVYESLRFF